MTKTLLLNATYEPIKVIDWQKAMTLFYKGRVEILVEHEKEVRAVSFTFRMPSVVRLLRFVRLRRSNIVPFTRASIYARDGHQCQYCGRQFKREMLTFDHVVPVAQGGGKNWENIVTACEPCNMQKGGRTPEEAGMRLLRTPQRPTAIPMLKVTIGLKQTPTAWFDFLYWNVELEQ